MAHCVFYQVTSVHHLVSSDVEINVRHTGGPTQHWQFLNWLLSDLITGYDLVFERFFTCMTPTSFIHSFIHIRLMYKLT